MTATLPVLLGGLVLFFLAIYRLSQVLRELFSGQVRDIVQRYTHNLFAGIGIGTVVTILLDSSSAVIILAIVLINARALTFRNALGIILGANIGTTFGSQLIAWELGRYAYLPMFVGLAMMVFSKVERRREIGHALIYFGMLFFGLYLIETAVEPLRERPQVLEWMTQFGDRPLRGALVGGLITLLIQSSSATVGMTLVLAKQNLISLAGGMAIMLGAELGTCSDTLLATIKGTRQAIKAGLFHFFFNLLTIIVGLVLFDPFVRFVEWLSEGRPVDNQLANAHVLFSVCGVLIFLPWVNPAARLLDRVLPERPEEPVGEA